MSQEIALRAVGLEKSFGPVRALGGVDFECSAGEVHALLGENGAGKSTLLKVIAGVHARDAGSLEYFGQEFAPTSPLDATQAGVATIHQELCLSPDLSVEQNIVLGREPRRGPVVDRKKQRELAVSSLEKLGASSIDPRSIVATLGPGERQLVEIARALAFDARVLILDEPTSSLTRPDIDRLFDVLRSLRREGRAIIYVSHFLEEVEEIADRYTVLRDGKSVATGSMRETNATALVEAMAGRRLDEVYPPHARTRGEPQLVVASLEGRKLPHDARFTLHRGEIFGIFGLVGAGRTEALRTLFGLDSAKVGDVRVGGTRLARLTPVASLANGIGFASEDRKAEGLALDLSIASNIALSRLDAHASRGVVSARTIAEKTEAFAEDLGVRRRSMTQAVSELSGGNQQKVAIARLLHHDVDVLLLDEPTRGIDVASKAEIYRRLDACARRGKAVLVVSSYVPELLGICDRIAVMYRGRLGEPREVSEWSEHALLEEATRGALAS